MWAPWRKEYVTGGTKPAGCVLCEDYEKRAEERSLVVHAGRDAFVVMNLYPYNAGHVMVAPVRHLGRLMEATPAELGEIMGLAQRLEGVFAEAFRPDGINLGMNLGKS